MSKEPCVAECYQSDRSAVLFVESHSARVGACVEREGGRWAYFVCAKALDGNEESSAHGYVADRDDAASEAAKQLFDLTARFTPVAHRELFGETKRTPETVLRAMIRAYSAAIVAALRIAEGDMCANRNIAALRRREHAIQDSLALVLSGQQMLDLLSLHNVDANTVLADYQARLNGARPLDSTPLLEGS